MQSRSMSKKPSGRVTPRKDAVAPAAPDRKEQLRQAFSNERWEIKESRSVRTGWIWRGFLILALFAVGIALVLNFNHHGNFAIAWLVIGAGWFATSMWLWRQHTRYIRGH
jgi:hypothetical protein